MSSFDPASVRKAVDEFMPLRPQKFQDLVPAKGVIVELRQKRASYRAIAELLTQHCLPTSKTAIAAFCHEILGEMTRPKRRTNRKRPFSLAPTNGYANGASNSASTSANAGTKPDAYEVETQPARKHGPRIAQVRMLNQEGS
jgi:hypothetical protein